MAETPASQTALEAERRRWLNCAHNEERRSPSALLISTHGLLLQHDIEKAFCAGAWLAVIVLAQAAIEATIRQIETSEYKKNAKEIFGAEDELQRIRSLRNEILHPMEPGTPSVLWSVPNGDAVACHAAQEELARVAVKLVFRIMYAKGHRKGKLNLSLKRTATGKPGPVA